MKNTLNPCGCDGGGGTIVITTSNVNYNGPATLCIPMNPGDNLTTILQRIDAIICDFADDLSDYYTKEQIDTILEDYAKLVDLLSSGEVVGNDIVFSNDAGPVFSVDASAFLAQGTTITLVNGKLSLLADDGTVLSSVDIPDEVDRDDITTWPTPAFLDSEYPTAAHKFKVYCKNITGGGGVFRKNEDGSWGYQQYTELT